MNRNNHVMFSQIEFGSFAKIDKIDESVVIHNSNKIATFLIVL